MIRTVENEAERKYKRKQKLGLNRGWEKVVVRDQATRSRLCGEGDLSHGLGFRIKGFRFDEGATKIICTLRECVCRPASGG